MDNTAAAMDATTDVGKMFLNSVEGVFGTLTDMFLDKVDGEENMAESKQISMSQPSPAASEESDPFDSIESDDVSRAWDFLTLKEPHL